VIARADSHDLPNVASEIPAEGPAARDARRREVACLLALGALRATWAHTRGHVANVAPSSDAAPPPPAREGLALGCQVERECPARARPARRARGSRTEDQREDDQ